MAGYRTSVSPVFTSVLLFALALAMMCVTASLVTEATIIGVFGLVLLCVVMLALMIVG